MVAHIKNWFGLGFTVQFLTHLEGVQKLSGLAKKVTIKGLTLVERDKSHIELPQFEFWWCSVG